MRAMEMERTRVGLCAGCRHVKELATKIGATIYQCRLAAKDARFRKFPPLPMLACPGFEKGPEEPGDAA